MGWPRRRAHARQHHRRGRLGEFAANLRDIHAHAAASTSAGVYDANGNLVRTLWSGVAEPAGTVTAYWNGLETNNTPAPNGNYTFKLLSNNVEYVCDGSMNNSSPEDGPNINGSYNPIDSMVIIGSNAYYSAGYNEGRFLLYEFSLSDPNQTTAYGVAKTSSNTINHISTDGTYLYALEESASLQTPVIEKFNLTFNLLDSESVSADYGSTGIAAQPPGCQNLLFVSHAGDNRVYIYNESNLTPYSTPYLSGAALGWNTPQAVANPAATSGWPARTPPPACGRCCATPFPAARGRWRPRSADLPIPSAWPCRPTGTTR